jgi:hypothetical protein
MSFVDRRFCRQIFVDTTLRRENILSTGHFVDNTFLRKILIFFLIFLDYMFYLVFQENRSNSGILDMEIQDIKEMLRIPEI